MIHEAAAWNVRELDSTSGRFATTVTKLSGGYFKLKVVHSYTPTSSYEARLSVASARIWDRRWTSVNTQYTITI